MILIFFDGIPLIHLSLIDICHPLLQVVIDYKSHKFEGLKGEVLRGLMIEMDFEGVGGVWKLIKLELKNIPYNANFYDLELHHTTQYGYQVSAPLGLCFSCNQPGKGCLQWNVKSYSG